MTPFTLPGILDLSGNPLTLTPGSYSELVADNGGTDDIDSDPILEQADTLQAFVDSQGDDPLGATDTVSALGAVQAQIPSYPGAQNAADMLPAIESATGHLYDYEGIIGPVVSPGQPQPPPTGPNPGGYSGPSSGCTPSVSVTQLADMSVGGAPLVIALDSSIANGVANTDFAGTLECGDAATFALSYTDVPELIGGGNTIVSRYFVLTVTPAAAGTFDATVLLTLVTENVNEQFAFAVNVYPSGN